MNDPSPLDPALRAAVDGEVARIGVDLEAFTQVVVDSHTARSDEGILGLPADDDRDWVPLLGLDLERFLTFLRTLPDGVGTEATIAAFLRANDPPRTA